MIATCEKKMSSSLANQNGKILGMPYISSIFTGMLLIKFRRSPNKLLLSVKEKVRISNPTNPKPCRSEAYKQTNKQRDRQTDRHLKNSLFLVVSYVCHEANEHSGIWLIHVFFTWWNSFARWTGEIEIILSGIRHLLCHCYSNQFFRSSDSELVSLNQSFLLLFLFVQKRGKKFRLLLITC